MSDKIKYTAKAHRRYKTSDGKSVPGATTVTGLLGDVLSYLRLYALGLAGGMLGMAFNDMGLMVLGDGSNAILWLPFILLVIIGHTLNIAMCALGAFVHPLRLNFLEFFKNSGYEASGRTYNPLKK